MPRIESRTKQVADTRGDGAGYDIASFNPGDVAFAERHGGETYTGAAWQFHHFGPWSLQVFKRIEPALNVVGIEPKRIPSRFSDDAVRYSLRPSDAAQIRGRAERELPSAVQFPVSHAIHELGSDTGSLLRSVYLTAPMLNASPEEQLDFATIVRETPIAYSPSAETALSKSQKKSRQRRLAEVRAEVQARLASREQATGVGQPAPRYDEVFSAGVQCRGEPNRHAAKEPPVTIVVGPPAHTGSQIDASSVQVHDKCMAVKTITIDMEAYETLARRKRPGQSFSQVIKENFGHPRTARDLAEALDRAQVDPATLDAVDEQIARRRRHRVRVPRL